MKQYEPLKNGNSKLTKGIWIFNLPPGKSCLRCKDCYTTCYAMKAYRQYSTVRACWDKHYDLARNDLDGLRHMITFQLAKLLRAGKEIKAVRIHSAGDFFSQEYVDMWQLIANMFPQVKFFAFTKSLDRLDFSRLMACENVNIINSFYDEHLNYGDREHISMLQQKYDTFVCPGSQKEKCGDICDYCFTNDRPCFLIH